MCLQDWDKETGKYNLGAMQNISHVSDEHNGSTPKYTRGPSDHCLYETFFWTNKGGPKQQIIFILLLLFQVTKGDLSFPGFVYTSVIYLY